jgi:hypothetical protein
MAPRDGGKLTFSFDAEVAGGVSALRRDQSVRFSDVRSAAGAARVLVLNVCIPVRPLLAPCLECLQHCHQDQTESYI